LEQNDELLEKLKHKEFELESYKEQAVNRILDLED